MKMKVSAVFIVAMVLHLSAWSSWSAVYLPPSGYPLSKTYEDFESYSVTVLDELNTGDYGYPAGMFDDFLGSTGTGQLEVLATTGSHGSGNTDNSVYGDFDDAVVNESPSFHGNWSAYLDDVLSFLREDGAFMPVFVFDLSEGGKEKDLYVTARVYLTVNGTSSEVGNDWVFDNGYSPDFESGYIGYDPVSGEYIMDTGEMVHVPSEIEVDVDNNGEFNPLIDFAVANSKGGGHGDFFVYAPSMDLWQYEGQNYRFNLEFNLAGTSSEGEEIFLTRAFQPSPTPVPEPSSMLFFGVGFTIFAFIARKFNIK